MTSERPVIVRQLPETCSHSHARLFFREILPLLTINRAQVVLDMSKVRELDGSGLSMLLHCMEEAMKGNGDLKLAAVPPEAAIILELTGVESLFEIFESPADAVESFQSFPVHAFRAPVEIRPPASGLAVEPSLPSL